MVPIATVQSIMEEALQEVAPEAAHQVAVQQEAVLQEAGGSQRGVAESTVLAGQGNQKRDGPSDNELAQVAHGMRCIPCAVVEGGCTNSRKWPDDVANR